ncbi:hypothetical protein PILCRDRAFT_10054 [Piloderma croceum F 1598]|uniref:Uncharacterized protein n=1 Tax=Piloderma croceum (strain F 1598) TaxID=765440 RepID=A0A0C3FK45_PILCF|nr:hypothetical protein PILCRDRAFT_10054 [Piloderma croceum F 1598]
MSIPSIPIAGVFVDPALSLALKVKIVNNQNEPTAIGTAVGLLQSRAAIQNLAPVTMRADKPIPGTVNHIIDPL